MRDGASRPTKGQPPRDQLKRRIETQIPRRKKNKANMPLEAEWDSSSTLPPGKLKMPPEQMKKED